MISTLYNLGHCPEDSLVQRSLAKIGGNVLGYRPDCRNHLSSLFLKKFRVHKMPASARRSPHAAFAAA
jgi:hypothetical protein